ncbi:hypothetical protein Pdw03_2557 [Penicillium digitatum]|uniref:Uncharacterized protein n=1 Tax=Penicillium digitatum TaxID=36651 RepID=A0A7T6XEL3_PENDI|nr:hypothetical protein Pdw03_2557 [Penicillium digitatum]
MPNMHTYPDVEGLKSNAVESHLTALGIDRQPRHVFADNNTRHVLGLGTSLQFNSFACSGKLACLGHT